MPLIKTTNEKQTEISNIVSEIISKKQQNSSANTSNLENQIDQLVYQLYNLTVEEIKIIENT